MPQAWVHPDSVAHPGFVAVNEPPARFGVERGNLGFELVRRPLVVGIEQGDPLVASRADPAIARRAHAPVRLAQNLERGKPLADHLQGLVVGAVVHDQHLRGRKRLLGDRSQGPFQEPGAIVGRDNDRDLRSHRRPSHPMNG